MLCVLLFYFIVKNIEVGRGEVLTMLNSWRFYVLGFGIMVNKVVAEVRLRVDIEFIRRFIVFYCWYFFFGGFRFVFDESCFWYFG